MQIAGIPIQVITSFLMMFFDGIKVPKEHRKLSYYQVEFSQKDIERYLCLIDRSGFSSQVMYGAKLYNLHTTKHKYRIWMNSNWNKDKPTLEGKEAEAVFGEILRCIRDTTILRDIRTREAARAAKILGAKVAEEPVVGEPERELQVEGGLEHEPRFEGV